MTPSGDYYSGMGIVLATFMFLVGTTDAYVVFPPMNNVPHCLDPDVQNFTLYYDMLTQSTQMPAQVGATRVGVPFSTLVSFFNQPQVWPIWNHLFKANFVTNYSLCSHFNNVSYTNPPPVVPPFPPTMTAPHWIDQHGFNIQGDSFAFGWIFQLRVNAEMIVYGRHTFTIRRYVDESGVDASTMESFEKVAGPQLDTSVNVVAWTVALQESLLDSLSGFMCLERVYTQFGRLDLRLVHRVCDPFKP